ncbi:hypothetical protein UlMin_000545 [Ulmus minor]
METNTSQSLQTTKQNFSFNASAASDDEEDSYIEIAIDEDDHNRREEELPDLEYLRISFSSSFPAEFETDQGQKINAEYKSPSSSSSVRLSGSSFRSSSTGTCRGPALVGSTESFSLYEGSRRRDHLTPFNPLVHTLLFSLDVPSEIADKNCSGHRRQLGMINADDGDVDLLRNRKASNITTTMNGGSNGIVKLLMIKFKAMKVRKMLSSLFMKTSGGNLNFFSPNNKANQYNRYTNRRADYYYDNNNILKDIQSTPSYLDNRQGRFGEKSRGFDVNLGAVRGVLEAAVNNVTSGGRKDRRTSSCPNSIKSSPIHKGFGSNSSKFYAGESSIQAAIAHCKSSLGQSSDFRF